MAERPKQPTTIDLLAQFGDQLKIDVRSPESPEERQSRLKREEAEEGHKRRIGLIVHIFVMAIVATALFVSSYLAVTGDPRTGLPDKAMGIITAIVAAAVGYMTGKGSK
jgi:hypothetical protein